MVSRLEYGHTVGLYSGDGCEVRIETGYTLTTAGGMSTHHPDSAVGESGPLDVLYQSVITAARVDQDGTLVLVSRGLLLQVAADRDFEAWTVCESNGRKVVCLPGGDLAVWAS